MKIQPEFNIAAILSKISVADVVSQQVLREGSDTSPFETYFEAALQQIDDPQLAATIATLNKSGMIVPDSSEAFLVSDPGVLSLQQSAASEAVPAFRTLQLLNGRSVITSHVALSDPFTAPADFAAVDVTGANPGLSVQATVSQSAALNSPPVVAIEQPFGEQPFVSRRQTTEEWLGAAGKTLGTHAALASFGKTPAPRVAADADTPVVGIPVVGIPAASSQIAQALQSRQAPPVPRFDQEPQPAEFEPASQATAFEPSAQAPQSVRAAQVPQPGRAAIATQMPPASPIASAAQALQSRQSPSVPRFEQEPQVAEFEQAPQATEFEPSAQAPQPVRAAQVPQPVRAAIATQMPPAPPITSAAQALQSRQTPAVPRFEQQPQPAEFEQAPQSTEFKPSAQAPQPERAATAAQMPPASPLTSAAQALQSTTPLVTPAVQAPATLQTPVTSQTTVIPQGQVINPDQPAGQNVQPAQEQVINAVERRQSTEAWLANPARMSTLASTLSQVKAPLPVGAPGLQVSKLTRPVMQTEPVGRAEMVESVERRLMTESWLSNAGKGLPVAGAPLKMTQPALPALNMLDSAAVAPLSLPESSGALVSSPGQPIALNPVALPAQAAANVNRAPDRWMHVDDLGKQFGSVIQSSLLDRSVAGQTSLRILLSPENMGSIEAEIIDNNQTVTVNLLVQSDEVVRMLKDNSQALRDALGQSGTFELNIQKDRSGPDAQQSRDSSSNGNRNNSQTSGLNSQSGDVVKNAKSASDTGALDTYV